MSAESRAKAWQTRREKYGASGHSKTAYGWKVCKAPASDEIAKIVDRLISGELSEGQASRAAGLPRIEIRTLVDERNFT